MDDLSHLTKIPKHVAIIMDGNGRWAKEQNLPRIEGHRSGVNNVESVVEVAGELGIPFLTLYAFSIENWNRPADEVEALMQLLVTFLEKQEARLIENKIRLKTIGRLHALPPAVQKSLQGTIARTAHFTEQTLILALNYGARTEILDAVQAYVKAGNKEGPADWDAFRPYLYTADIPDPDLVIRTSGEQRMSNFLLMQSAYAELFFHKKPWPEFHRTEFLEAIAAYQQRERRYGLTSAQLTNTPS